MLHIFKIFVILLSTLRGLESILLFLLLHFGTAKVQYQNQTLENHLYIDGPLTKIMQIVDGKHDELSLQKVQQ